MNDWGAQIRKARSQLLVTEPFWATLAVRLGLVDVTNDPVLSKTVATLATDSRSLFYNPAGLEAAGWTMDVLKTVVAEEGGHCGLGHPFRMGSREPQQWNEACDEAILNILKKAGFHIPPNSCCHPQFADMTAEKVYELLSKQNQQKQPQPGQGGAKGNQPSSGGQQPQHSRGEVLPAPGDTKEQEQGQQEWKMAMQQALVASKMAGKTPAGMDRMVAELLRPKVQWSDYLRKYVEAIMPKDFTWNRPSRLSAALGVYLPSVRKDGLAELVFAVDASGSITEADLTQANTEGRAIQEELNPSRMWALSFDTKVYDPVSFRPGESFEIRKQGGGGTDFRPVFDWIDQEGIRPKCLIMLTDLEGWFPDREPGYPVLWVTHTVGKEAPFGDTVYMEN